MTLQDFTDKLLFGVVTAALGFLAAAWRKVSPKQLLEFEERVIDPLCERLEKVEVKVEGFCTRSELKDAVNEMKSASEINRRENRENFRQIFNRLEQRR